MDRSIPPAAALLLDFIGEVEAPRGYDTIYGNNQGGLKKPLTAMTLGEVVAAQGGWTKRYGSSAAGRYQFMRATLQDLSRELSLSGAQQFDADFQDRLGYHLLKRRGYEDYMGGRISRTEFGRRLAQEWASLPVLKADKGAHRRVVRGETYYAGDKLNKSLVTPARVEAVLDEAKNAGRAAAQPKAETQPVQGIRTDRTTVEVVQRRLHELGYTEVGSRRADGTFDGRIGKMTAAAILAFRNENGLPVSDAIDAELLAALDRAKPRYLPRNGAPPDVVRQQAPEVRSNWLVKVGALMAGIPAAIGGLFDGILGNLGLARGAVDSVRSYVADVPGWVWLGAVVAIAAGAYLVARHGERKGIEAYQAGERR